ncbi:unnamed protein product, partial [marine sediment metagenome]
GIDGVTVYGTGDPLRQLSPVSFNIRGADLGEVGLRLDEQYDILCRVGLHCAPAAHRTLGTFPHGTVRFSPGSFTSAREVTAAVEAVRALAAQAAR